MLPDPPYKPRPQKMTDRQINQRTGARGGRALPPPTHGIGSGGVASGNYGLSSILKMKRGMTQ